MKTYTEEQVDCLLNDIEDRILFEKYEGDDESIYEADVLIRDRMVEMLREVKADKDIIIKRKFHHVSTFLIIMVIPRLDFI